MRPPKVTSSFSVSLYPTPNGQHPMARGGHKFIASVLSLRTSPMAGREPRQGEMLLGGDISEQMPGMGGHTIHRSCGRGSMLRVDRQHAEAPS